MKRTAFLAMLGLPLLATAQITVAPPLTGAATAPGDIDAVTRPADPATDAVTDPFDALATPPAIQPGTLVNDAVSTDATATGTAADGDDALAANGTTGGATRVPGLDNPINNGGGIGLGGTPGVSGDRISNAMSAAPPAVSANATIMEFPASADAQSITLRGGNNGWTCFPDNPATPGNDPACFDRQWMAWLDGVLNQRAPVITGPGVAYMLQGGSQASSSDPFATQPAAGQTWMTVPPAILLLSPQRWDTTLYPTEMGLTAGGPWIMFANTPWEHLVVPVPTAGSGAAASGAAPGITPVR
ncbi:MAG: hypothetical protein K0S46_2517 [Moraxellaceae bacterium]|jgi:hypothetical protein|nr:hypothetical protein [Moraxellaceae bacterium]